MNLIELTVNGMGKQIFNFNKVETYYSTGNLTRVIFDSSKYYSIVESVEQIEKLLRETGNFVKRSYVPSFNNQILNTGTIAVEVKGEDPSNTSGAV